MKRILFLDIDGVMNAAAFEAARNDPRFKRDELSDLEMRRFENPCEPHISILNWIKSQVPGLTIVLSSTWRYDMEPTGWDRFFATLGIDIRVVGKTPRLNTERGIEVADWLIENLHGEDDVKFVVLDDDFDPELPWVEERWVKVENRVGLIREGAFRVVDVFEAQSPVDWKTAVIGVDGSTQDFDS